MSIARHIRVLDTGDEEFVKALQTNLLHLTQKGYHVGRITPLDIARTNWQGTTELLCIPSTRVSPYQHLPTSHQFHTAIQNFVLKTNGRVFEICGHINQPIVCQQARLFSGRINQPAGHISGAPDSVGLVSVNFGSVTPINLPYVGGIIFEQPEKHGFQSVARLMGSNESCIIHGQSGRITLCSVRSELNHHHLKMFLTPDQINGSHRKILETISCMEIQTFGFFQSFSASLLRPLSPSSPTASPPKSLPTIPQAPVGRRPVSRTMPWAWRKNPPTKNT
jgi:hypothetical protein